MNSLTSGVYNLDSTNAKSTAGRQAKPRLQGSTTDLALLSFHASTLAPGSTNHPLRALEDKEELVIVKDGQLTIILNDSSKTLGPGSIALLVAGDKQSFQNTSDKPVTYLVLGFKSLSPVDINRGKASGGSLVKDWTELAVKKTTKGESRQVFDRPSSMFPRFEVHATTLNAGEQSHPPHIHRAEEVMLLMKGSVSMNIASVNYKAVAGDAILVRPDVAHNLTNAGNEQCWYYAIKWFNEVSN
ncbi:MAG TPA: cupin domain-containing protein [Chitinophagaceae bacterium]|nr:cupin domain-containing protein [Chitinophagaceae bacterium]